MANPYEWLINFTESLGVAWNWLITPLFDLGGDLSAITTPLSIIGLGSFAIILGFKLVKLLPLA